MDPMLVALLVALPILVVLARIVFIPNGVTFEDLLRRTDLAWPRGVQEEEPRPWHLERLEPRSHRR
jgi:hypothetical protein